MTEHIDEDRHRYGVVVVGAGLAGITTATSLRAHGYRGPITLVGAESRRPYDRPPLSKGVLTGDVDIQDLPGSWATLDLRGRFGCHAQSLREDAVLTSEGEIPYDALVVATGSRPLSLPRLGSREPHLVRTAEDALSLRESFTPGTRVVVVGGGWLGAEIASTATTLRCEVSVIEAASTPLENVVGPTVGAVFGRWYADAGIDLFLDRPVSELHDDAVLLADGSSIPADVVVVAIGAVPYTDWLDGALELDTHGGVVTDSWLRTSQPGVYAAGDCAAYPSRRYAKPMRVEHWTHAQHSGMAVAKIILGGNEAYDPVPYFWSKQFNRMIQYVGEHDPCDDIVWRGHPDDGRWSVCWMRGNEITAVLAVNRPRDAVDARRLLRQPDTRYRRPELADPATTLAKTVQ